MHESDKRKDDGLAVSQKVSSFSVTTCMRVRACVHVRISFSFRLCLFVCPCLIEISMLLTQVEMKGKIKGEKTLPNTHM